MAKDLSFDTTPGSPTVQLWVNDLVAIMFYSPNELERFAKDILELIPNIRETQDAE